MQPDVHPGWLQDGLCNHKIAQHAGRFGTPKTVYLFSKTTPAYKQNNGNSRGDRRETRTSRLLRSPPPPANPSPVLTEYSIRP